MIAEELAVRLHREADAARWQVTVARFTEALTTSAAKAFSGRTHSRREVEQYLRALHLTDLALACACADGDDAAWEHFIREHRPGLYRAGDAMLPDGGGRELADSLYGELFGMSGRAGDRRSILRLFPWPQQSLDVAARGARAAARGSRARHAAARSVA